MDASLTEAFAAVMEKLRWYPFEELAIYVGDDWGRLYNRAAANGENLYPQDYIVLLQDVVHRTNVCSRHTVEGDISHGGLARLRQEASVAAQCSYGADAEAYWKYMASEWQLGPPEEEWAHSEWELVD